MPKQLSKRIKLPTGSLDIIQVGTTKLIKAVTHKRYVCKYSDVPADKDGWVTDLKYFPINCDMMYLRIEGKMRIIGGWWDGRKWTGLRMKPEDRVTAWKRNIYDY